jgi:hypothetical protein
MRGGRSQLLIKNLINRYLINSPMLPDMKMDADGGLTLYIQHESPGKDFFAAVICAARRDNLTSEYAPVREATKDGSRPGAGTANVGP